jgi:hypothetical protein
MLKATVTMVIGAALAFGAGGAAFAQDGATPEAAAPTTDAAQPAPGAAQPTAAAPAAEGGEHDGLFGPLRVGATAAVGFPHPLTFGLDATYAGLAGGGVSFGSFKTPEVGGASVSISNWDVRGRWFPFRGSFFLGAAYGSQTIEAKATDDIAAATGQKVDTSIKLKVDTTYMTPHLGWFATWDSGFTLGFELGYQIALSSKAKDPEVHAGTAAETEAVTQTDDFKKAQKDAKDATERFGKTSLPYLTLLRLGWLL